MNNKFKKADILIFKFISDNANDAHFLSGRDAMFNYVNETACKMMGYSQNELVNLGVPDVDTLYDISKYQELFDLVQKETVPSLESINKRKDGTTFPSEITVTGYQIEGRPFMFAALRDITDRKKAEDELIKKSEDLQTIFKVIPDLFFRLDEKGRIIYHYSGKESDLYVSPDKFINKTMQDVLPANVSDMFAQVIRKAKKTNSPQTMEYSLLIDGTERFFEGRILPLDQQVMIVVRNITDRKNADEALQNAHDELEIKIKKRTRELEESNTALKVLLKQRDNDKTHLEQNILTNIKQLILPYIDKIRKNAPEKDTLTSLSILESNLKEIVSPFANKLSSNYLGLTPKEIDISNLIIIGKQDKEISKILNISPETVKSHRQNIRKKLGIYSKRTNLRTHLLTLSN